MVGHNSRSCPNEENRELMKRKKRKHIPTVNPSNSVILAISDIVADIEGEEVNDDDDEALDEIVDIIDKDNEEEEGEIKWEIDGICEQKTRNGRKQYEEPLPKFKGPTPGPVKTYIEGGNENGKRCETILDFLSLFITNIMIETFVAASNAYGRMFMSKYWKKDLTVSEFKAFLTIVIYAGLTKYPDQNLCLVLVFMDHNSLEI
jgi:hypothetical protein